MAAPAKEAGVLNAEFQTLPEGVLYNKFPQNG
jgi:hypothetical protein